jgi:hypothetical protein
VIQTGIQKLNNKNLMKQSILSNWTFIRALRLLLGLAVVVQALVLKDTLLGVAGLLFSGLAILNRGCCGQAGCATPAGRSSRSNTDTTYDEVL